MLRDDIPVTAPARTLVDLATELDSVALERAVNDADKRNLIDPEALREDLARFGGEPGVRPLRHLLDKLFFRLSDSDLEIYFRRIVKTAKLPIPLTKQRITRSATNPAASARSLSRRSRCFGSASGFDHSPLGQESDATLTTGRNL